MCGICGFYSSSGVFSENDLRKMTSSLAHRGPDADGVFQEGSVGLGHRRLSIIDLSQAANQPMVSHNERYVIVYNGEVYNYKEIESECRMQNAECRIQNSEFRIQNSEFRIQNSEFRIQNAEFRIQNSEFRMKTSSDTEVILEAFTFWGVDFVHKLNGMFAIAIYDKVENSLFIFRDRLGIKPLYYYWDGQNFAFASELKALKQSEFIRKNISTNPVAINEYLHLGYVPEPNSIYQKIYKFSSGSFAKINKDGLEIKSFWTIEDKIKPHSLNNEQEAFCQLKELLVSSVKYCMISDVPFGTFLSGGIDSSLVTAIAQSLSAEPVKTFNIRFAESTFDESPYAKAIAAYLGTNHHEYTVTEKDAIELIPGLLDIYDEPYADSSAIPTLLVSKMARQNVSMTLSGDGGDELFMGYGAYNWARRLKNPFIKALRKPAHLLLSNMSNKYRRVSTLFDYENEVSLKSHIFSQEQYFFSRKEVRSFVNPDFYREIKLQENFADLSRKLNPAEQQSLFDLNYYLKNDLLVKVDKASMHYSLETRVPLLDYRIVEFAYNLSPDLRYRNGISKYLLKKVLYNYIPSTYFDRPKWGFAIPLQKWLKNDLKYLINDFLSEEKVNASGIFNYRLIEKLKNDFFFNGRDYLYNRLWQAIILQKFLSV